MVPQVETAILEPEETELKEEKSAEPEPIAPEIKREDLIKKVEPGSKTRAAFRKGIRWTAGLLIIFGLGLLTGIFLFYRPAIREAENNATRLGTEQAASNEEIIELQNQVADLEEEIAAMQPLKNRNDELQAEQQGLNLHIAILDARLDVADAQLALANEPDNTRVRIILNQTANTLDRIKQLLDPDQKEIVNDLRARLDLVMGELEEDSFAARSDLDVLGTKLLQLEDSLFGD